MSKHLLNITDHTENYNENENSKKMYDTINTDESTNTNTNVCGDKINCETYTNKVKCLVLPISTHEPLLSLYEEEEGEEEKDQETREETGEEIETTNVKTPENKDDLVKVLDEIVNKVVPDADTKDIKVKLEESKTFKNRFVKFYNNLKNKFSCFYKNI